MSVPQISLKTAIRPSLPTPCINNDASDLSMIKALIMHYHVYPDSEILFGYIVYTAYLIYLIITAKPSED